MASAAQQALANSILAKAGLSPMAGIDTGARANAYVASQKHIQALAANEAKRVSSIQARGLKQQAASAAHETIVQGNLAAVQATAANLVALRGQNAANRVANRLSNFNTKLLNQVANAGSNVLTPTFEAKINSEQSQFVTSIAKQGGNYIPIPLAAISPQIQNKQLANAGIGLTNFQQYQQLTANANGLTAALAALGNTPSNPNPTVNPVLPDQPTSTVTVAGATGTSVSPVLNGGVLGGTGGTDPNAGSSAGSASAGTSAASASPTFVQQAAAFLGQFGFTSWTQAILVLGGAAIVAALAYKHYHKKGRHVPKPSA